MDRLQVRVYCVATDLHGNRQAYTDLFGLAAAGNVDALVLGGELVNAGRYTLTVMPHAEGSWSFTLSPLPGQVLEPASVSFEAAVDTGTESINRLEFYFDRTREGTKVLVMAWGNKTVRVTVEDPAADGL